VEGLSAGKPVLARDEGFPCEVIEHGKTGILHDGNSPAISTAVIRAEDMDFETTNTERFSGETFKEEVRSYT
jgi:glycosyltransferase involved in cell wall biosynthesis